jgi:phosphoribosylamine--glycine ligase
MAQNLPAAAEDVHGIVQAVQKHKIDLTVVGPEAPLAEGLVDRLQELGLAAFGPSEAAAQIEASKGFAKGLMQRHGIPHAEGAAFTDYRAAQEYLSGKDLPIVVKADGLAAGKGVTVAQTREEALAALRDCLENRAFGAAGEKVVIEECLVGPEVSIFVFTDGEHLSPMVAACDYKRIFDDDRGPNTGGMGSYSPPAFWTEELADRIGREIMGPTVRALAQEGRPYRGILYGGLIVTEDGPKVMEFNCRLGDPETQVILPLLDSDLLEIIVATLEGQLAQTAIEWEKRACVGVVMASGGYPASYPTGFAINGLDGLDDETIVFHAGTREDDGGRVVTAGGRVLTVVGKGTTLEAARERAYTGAEHIDFQGAHYRKDIALFGAEGL